MFHRAEEAALNRSSCRQFADGMQDLARRNASPRTGERAGHDATLTTIKTVHTLAWFSIESCMLYVLYAGFTGRSGRRTAIAAAVVAGESLIFAATVTASGARSLTSRSVLATSEDQSPTSTCRTGSPVICPRSTCR